MQIDLLTLFPEFFASPLSQSMLKRAQDQGAVSYGVIKALPPLGLLEAYAD